MSEEKLKQVFLYLPVSVLEEDHVFKNGSRYPMISFGITEMEGFENIYNAVDIALETGYRSFDCSSLPEQQEHLGNALEELLSKYELNRRSIKITSKIQPKDYGTYTTWETFWWCCQKLKTDYLDTYLMEWPGGDNLDPEDEENVFLRTETWRELDKLKWRGAVRNIGVCNFDVKHLESLEEESGIIPSINQVEFHPRYPQLELLEYCKEKDILMQAISFKDTFHPLLLTDGIIKEVSKVVKRTPDQVLLKWIINKGVAVISQSENPKKIKQNFNLFDFVLEKPEMDAINSITEREKYLWNPICVV